MYEQIHYARFDITSITTTKNYYRVYAIHGLQSSTGTWGGYVQQNNPNGSLRWLDYLSEQLQNNSGKAVDVSLVGWNTQVRSTTNFSVNIQSSVRSLANTIIAQRGETNVRGSTPDVRY